MGIRRDQDVFSPNQYEDVYYEAPIIAQRAPGVNDKYELGKVWIDRVNDDVYFMTNVTAGNAVWINAGGGTGVFHTLTATTGDITATLGDIVASAGDLIATAGSATLGGLGEGTLITSAAGVVTALADSTDGTVLIGTTGGRPAWAALTAGAGINITNAAGGVTITATGAVASTFPCDGGTATPAAGATTIAGGTNITTAGAGSTVTINLDASPAVAGSLTAGVDLNMTSGDCTIVGDTDAAQTIYLHANGGASETIDIHSDQGTGVNSVNIHSDVGGLTLESGLATTDAINITATAGGVDVDAADQIRITGTENAADAIVIEATSGGIDITGTGVAGEDIDISTSASINLVATEDAAEAIYLRANGGVSETIRIHSDNGTSATSIDMDTDVGGITMTAGLASNDAINIDATNGGVDVDAALQINLASAQAAADAIVIDAADAAGGLDIDYGTGGCTVDGANGAFTLQTGTGNILIGADAVQHNVTLGNVTGTTAVALNSGTGGVAVNTTGAGDFVVTSADTVLIDAAGVLELNSSAGVIGIGNDDIDQAVNISTDGERTTTIGSTNGAAGVVVDCGTTGASFGASATAHTTTLGTTNTTSITTLQSGSGAMTFTAGGIWDVNAVGAITLDSSAGTIGIGVNDDDFAINIGTVGERVVTIGNIVGVTQIVGNAGTGGIQLASTGAGDITINSDDTLLLDADGIIEINSSAGTIDIGSDADNQAIRIAGAGERTVTIGNNTGASSVVCQVGTGPAYFGANATAHLSILGSSTGASTTTVQAGTGGLSLEAAGIVDMVPAVSSAATTSTINANVGSATFTGFTTASAATETITITNSVCTSTSAILISASNLGANDAQMNVTRVTPGAGSFVVQVTNSGAAALNGNLVLTFWIIAA